MGNCRSVQESHVVQEPRVEQPVTMRRTDEEESIWQSQFARDIVAQYESTIPEEAPLNNDCCYYGADTDRVLPAVADTYTVSEEVPEDLINTNNMHDAMILLSYERGCNDNKHGSSVFVPAPNNVLLEAGEYPVYEDFEYLNWRRGIRDRDISNGDSYFVSYH